MRYAFNHNNRSKSRFAKSAETKILRKDSTSKKPGSAHSKGLTDFEKNSQSKSIKSKTIRNEFVTGESLLNFRNRSPLIKEDSNRKIHKQKLQQLAGFKKSILIWIYTSVPKRSFLTKERFSVSQHHLDRFIIDNFYPIVLCKQPKSFKSFLAWNFSYYTRQELPDSDVCIPLTSCEFIPRSLKIRMDQCKNGLFKTVESRDQSGSYDYYSESSTMRRMWNLLQCKSYSNKVPQEMILGAYRDHSDILCQQSPILDDSFLHEFEHFITPLVDSAINKLQDLFVTPNNHANLTHSYARWEFCCYSTFS